MKIIEALKKLKSLEKKADDIRDKVSVCCCDMDFETPMYSDQRATVDGWLQSYCDILKEISSLHYRIQKTNNSVEVKISLDGKEVKKSISEWIMRRRKLIKMEESLWKALSDKNLKEGKVTNSSGQLTDLKIRRYYDPRQRDGKLDALREEPFEIDSALEVVNAVTDLLE